MMKHMMFLTACILASHFSQVVIDRDFLEADPKIFLMGFFLFGILVTWFFYFLNDND